MLQLVNDGGASCCLILSEKKWFVLLRLSCFILDWLSFIIIYQPTYWTSQVVTCGNFPLESSFQRVPRCVYTSTCLYEYRGWDSKAANTEHRQFTWGLRSMEVSFFSTENLIIIKMGFQWRMLTVNPTNLARVLIFSFSLPWLQRHAVDFYISDFQSGLRALVKTGYGARVTPYVDESVVIDINPDNKDMSPEFLRWLRERNLSSDDRIMRLKEGYSSCPSSASEFWNTHKLEIISIAVIAWQLSIVVTYFIWHMGICTADTLRRAARWVLWGLFKGTTTCWWLFLHRNPSPLAASGPSASSLLALMG